MTALLRQRLRRDWVQLLLWILAVVLLAPNVLIVPSGSVRSGAPTGRDRCVTSSTMPMVK